MTRSARVILEGETAEYHIRFRTALNEFPIRDVEKDELEKIIYRFSTLYFTEVYGYRNNRTGTY